MSLTTAHSSCHSGPAQCPISCVSLHENASKHSGYFASPLLRTKQTIICFSHSSFACFLTPRINSCYIHNSFYRLMLVVDKTLCFLQREYRLVKFCVCPCGVLVRLIETCLNETYIRVREGKRLCDMFPITNGLKQGDA